MVQPKLFIKHNTPNPTRFRLHSVFHMSTMSSSSTRPAPPPLDLTLTIVSAKHLKNVNWRHGPLAAHAVAYLDPDRRAATKTDDYNSTSPVWNERLTLPLPPASPPVLSLDVLHSSTPVASFRGPLADLIPLSPSPKPLLLTLPLLRPSGRPQGKIKLLLSVSDRPYPPDPSFHHPYSPYYYSSPPPRPYAPPYPHYPPYSDPYYPSYAPAPRPYYERGPSAPVDYSSGYASYEKPKSGRVGVGVGAVAGAMGGLALEEGLRHEDDRVESDLAARDDYSDYRADY